KVGRMGGSSKGSRGAAAADSAILPVSTDLRVVLRVMVPSCLERGILHPPWRGRVGLPKAVRGGVAAVQIDDGDAVYAETLSPPPGPLARADLPPPGGGEDSRYVISSNRSTATPQRQDVSRARHCGKRAKRSGLMLLRHKTRVIAGLDPAIHPLRRRWTRGSSPRVTHKVGHCSVSATYDAVVLSAAQR